MSIAIIVSLVLIFGSAFVGILINRAEKGRIKDQEKTVITDLDKIVETIGVEKVVEFLDGNSALDLPKGNTEIINETQLSGLIPPNDSFETDFGENTKGFKVGDKIEILEDGLEGSDVKKGEIYIINEVDSNTLKVPDNFGGFGWFFSLVYLNNGFKLVSREKKEVNTKVVQQVFYNPELDRIMLENFGGFYPYKNNVLLGEL